MVGLGDGVSLLLISFACIAQARPGVEKRSAGYGYGGGAGGEEMDGGFKFTDDTILPNIEKEAQLGTYRTSSDDLDIPHINLEEHQVSMERETATIGSGFHDIGPKDVGQEIFAKMEEAAQHAMTIVEGAQKFTDEAAKEQSIKGDANGAYQEQLSLSPGHIHAEGSSDPSMPAAHAPAAAADAPAEEHKEEAAGGAGQQPPPPAGGQPAPPSGKPY